MVRCLGQGLTFSSFSPLYACPIVLAQFVEKAILPSLNCFWTFVKNQLDISTNDAGKTGYPPAKKWIWIDTSPYIQKLKHQRLPSPQQFSKVQRFKSIPFFNFVVLYCGIAQNVTSVLNNRIDNWARKRNLDYKILALIKIP